MRNHERESCTVVSFLEESIFLTFFFFLPQYHIRKSEINLSVFIRRARFQRKITIYLHEYLDLQFLPTTQVDPWTIFRAKSRFAANLSERNEFLGFL